MLAFINERDSSRCCGCGACVSICAHKALRLVENAEGYKEPTLDAALCIDCGLCEKVCPMTNAARVLHIPRQVYAAINKDTATVRASSSGGVFSVIAEHTLREGGAVYGAAFGDGMTVRHIRISRTEDLARLRGSKYVQSDTEGVFRQVKDDLRRDLPVYFTGVPCQVAALKLYLRKDYPNLTTTDIVCHGVPSQRMFNLFLDCFQKRRNAVVVGYKFRDKRVNGWSCSSSCSCRNAKSDKAFEILYDKTLNSYMNAFLSGAIDRKSCYVCPFARHERTGDLTLADYWGVRRHHPEMDMHNGVSLLLVNTDRGGAVLNSLADKLHLTPSRLELAAQENPNLSHPTPMYAGRGTVYSEAFAAPETFVARWAERNYPANRLKFEAKRLVKSTPWLYSLLKKLLKR